MKTKSTMASMDSASVKNEEGDLICYWTITLKPGETIYAGALLLQGRLLEIRNKDLKSFSSHKMEEPSELENYEDQAVQYIQRHHPGLVEALKTRMMRLVTADGKPC